MVKKKKLVIIGAGSHSSVVADAAKLMGYSVEGYIDPFNIKSKIEKKILSFSSIKKIKNKVKIIIAVGDNKKRSKLYSYYKKNLFSYAKVIHPSAIVANSVKIGEGTFVSAGSILNANTKILNNSIINSGSIIEHDSLVKNHAHIAPGVKIGGNSIVGNLCLIGIGSVLIDYIDIGENTIVGAGSVVIKNLKKNSKFIGIPAKEIK